MILFILKMVLATWCVIFYIYSGRDEKFFIRGGMYYQCRASCADLAADRSTRRTVGPVVLT